MSVESKARSPPSRSGVESSCTRAPITMAWTHCVEVRGTEENTPQPARSARTEENVAQFSFVQLRLVRLFLRQSGLVHKVPCYGVAPLSHATAASRSQARSQPTSSSRGWDSDSTRPPRCQRHHLALCLNRVGDVPSELAAHHVNSPARPKVRGGVASQQRAHSQVRL